MDEIYNELDSADSDLYFMNIYVILWREHQFDQMQQQVRKVSKRVLKKIAEFKNILFLSFFEDFIHPQIDAHINTLDQIINKLENRTRYFDKLASYSILKSTVV